MGFERERTALFPRGLPLIRSRRETEKFLQPLRSTNKKIVFVNGCFDLLHPGHIQLFFEAAGLGDVLIVAINSDSSIQRLKGPSRPILQESVRLTMVSALKPVAAAFCFDEDDASQALTFVRPHIYAKGAQYKNKPFPESEAVKSLGAQVQYLNHLHGFSTSLLAQHIAKGQQGKFDQS